MLTDFRHPATLGGEGTHGQGVANNPSWSNGPNVEKTTYRDQRKQATVLCFVGFETYSPIPDFSQTAKYRRISSTCLWSYLSTITMIEPIMTYRPACCPAGPGLCDRQVTTSLASWCVRALAKKVLPIAGRMSGPILVVETFGWLVPSLIISYDGFLFSGYDARSLVC